MTSNNIEYITHKIINGDVSLRPTKEWHHNVEADLRNTWLPRVGDVENVVTAISYKKDAVYYTLFRKVKTSRDGDFQFVCIHIPYFMELDMDTLVTALERIKVYVKDNEIQTPEDSVVDGIISEIKVIKNSIVLPTSYMRGDRYAYRRLGGLKNIKYADIIKGQNQSEYNQYGVLFVLGENMSPSGIEDASDLSNTAIKKYEWFSKSQLVGLEEGVSVYYNDKPFDSPVSVESNGKISLTFKKRGFIDQKMDISVRTGEVGKILWKFPVTKDMFDVRNKSNRIVNNFRIVLEGRNLPFEINESKLGNTYNISVSAEGYKTQTVPVQFNPQNDRVSIVLEKKEVEYFIYPKNSSPIQLVFPPDYKPMLQDGKRPLACYKIVGRNQKDNVIVAKLELDKEDVINCAKEYEGGSNWFSKRLLKLIIPIISLLGALTIGTLIGHYVWKSDNFNNLHDSYAEGVKLTPVEAKHKPKKPTSTEIANSANDYLNTHLVWERDEMEKYEPLKGVWDAMNTYDYEMIKKVDVTYHFDSQEWRKIIDAINNHKYIRDINKGEWENNPICSKEDTRLTIVDAVDPANNYVTIINTKIENVQKHSRSVNGTVHSAPPKSPKGKTEKKKSNDLESES